MPQLCDVARESERQSQVRAPRRVEQKERAPIFIGVNSASDFAQRLRNRRSCRRDFGAQRRNTERQFRLFRVMRCRELERKRGASDEQNRNLFRSRYAEKERAPRSEAEWERAISA